MANPFRALWGVRREEAPAAAAMSACFFVVIAVFWILKPLKKALFIERYDAAGFDLLEWHLRASQAELLAKILNTAAAFLAMWLLSALSRRLDRSRLVTALAAGLAACCLGFALLLGSSSGAVVWAFYVFGDVFNMLLVAAFFAFANDSVTPEAVKRLYGPVVLGGVLGGVFGSTALASSIDALSPSAWLVVAACGTAAVGGTAHLAGRLAKPQDQPRCVFGAPGLHTPNHRLQQEVTRRERFPDGLAAQWIGNLHAIDACHKAGRALKLQVIERSWTIRRRGRHHGREMAAGSHSAERHPH